MAFLETKSGLEHIETLLYFLFEAGEHLDKTVIVEKKQGLPEYLRTDNEAVFISKWFRLGLLLLGIRHQRTEVACPWQNGRIERYFGTLKEKLNLLEVDSAEDLKGSLNQFRFWYNFVRPHQNLDGRTPAELWQGLDVFTGKAKRRYRYDARDGLLKGCFIQLK